MLTLAACGSSSPPDETTASTSVPAETVPGDSGSTQTGNNDTFFAGKIAPYGPALSCSEDGRIVQATSAAYQSYADDGYTRMAALEAPNGLPIPIFAQGDVTDAQLIRAYNILRFLLVDVPGSEWGESKADIVDTMAQNGAAVVMPNGSHDADPTSDGQPQFENETQVEGSNWYLAQDYREHRDSTYEELFHLIHANGLSTDQVDGVRPDYAAAILAQATEAAANGLWTAPDGRIGIGEEYIISVIDSYYGLWGAFEGGAGIFGEYQPATRDAVETQDPVGYGLVTAFLPDALTYEARLDPTFDGTFEMSFSTDLGYTHHSQYLENVTLTGTNPSAVNGNDRDNFLRGNTADNELDGGDGNDTAVYCLPQASYTIETAGDTTTITGPDGTDKLTNIESVAFTDASIDLG